MADQLLLIVSAALVMLLLELRLRGVSIWVRCLLAIPAVLLVFFFLIPSVLLALGGLGTILLIVFLVYESEAFFGASPGRVLSSIFVILTATVAALSVVSMARWILDAVDGSVPLSGWTWGPSMLLMELLNQSYWLLPRMFLLFFLAWAVRLVLGFYWQEIRGFFSELSAHFGSAAPSEEPLVPDGLEFYLVVASILGAAFVGAYPYLPGINVNSILVGYDIRTYYYPSVQLMLSQGPSQALGFAFSADRALALVLQYSIAELTGSGDIAARVMPFLLALLLTASTYCFVRVGFRDRVLAATASIFAALSFTVVAGINAGFEANWLADSEALVLFSVLLLGLDRSDRRYVVIALVPSIILLLTHPWTWLVIMGVLATYAIFTGVRWVVTGERDGLRFDLTSIGFLLLVNLVADQLRRLAVGLGGVQVVYGSVVPSLSLSNLLAVVGSLQSTVAIFLGGALDNSLVVLLAIVGVLAISDTRIRMNRLLLSWVALTSIGILFASFTMGYFQARVILLAPVEVLAAMGFLSTLRYVTNLMSQGGQVNRTLVKAFVLMAYVSIFALLMSCALQNVGFLYTGA